MSREPYHIRSFESLHRLSAEARRGRRRRFAKLIVDVPEFSTDENQQWQQRISRLYFACGCDVASIAAPLGLVAFVIWLLIMPPGWRLLSLRNLLFAAVAVFVAGGIGKSLGLLRAHRMLRKTLDDLATVLRKVQPAATTSPLEVPPSRPLCGIK